MKRFLLALMLMPFFACRQKAVDAIRIIFDKTQLTVKVTGVSQTTLNGMARDSMALATWQNLFPVYAMPADQDMRDDQLPIQGKYIIQDKLIVFKPDTPFKAGQTYFARYYRYDERITTTDLVLHKRQLGKATYTQLIFKY